MYDNTFDYLIDNFKTDLVPPKLQDIEVFDLKAGIKLIISARFFVICQTRLISDIYM
jgi:hypothetical protein